MSEIQSYWQITQAAKESFDARESNVCDVAGSKVWQIDHVFPRRTTGATRSPKSALQATFASVAAAGLWASRGSELIVYYTGHGSKCGDWILPSASQSYEAVTLADMLSWLADQQMPTTIVSDCCFSGNWCKHSTLSPSTLKAFQQLRIISACAEDRMSYIGELLGYFATGAVSTKQRPCQRLMQYSHRSVLHI